MCFDFDIFSDFIFEFQFNLPKGIDIDKITSEVRLNGKLVISAPQIPGN